jgi:hypothetical protein
VLAVICSAVVCSARRGKAEEPAGPAKPETLPEMLARIHEHAADADWRAAGWKDERIEGWLEGVTRKIAVAAKFPELKLPVRFADVKPTEDVNPSGLDYALLVGTNFRMLSTKLRHCIVLADGNFLGDSVQDCIIIARGAVSVTTSDSSIIVAGAYARTNADGQSRNLVNGSLILTPGWTHVEQISGTAIFGGEGISTGRQVDGAIFLNATIVTGDMFSSLTQRRPRSVKVRELPLGELVNHPLSQELDVKGIIYSEAMEPVDPLSAVTPLNRNAAQPRPTGLVLRYSGRRYVVNIGKPILNQNEESVAGLVDWKLSYVNDKITIFSNGQADAILRLEDL